MEKFPVAPIESIIYEDEKLYVCLAIYPITKGHTIVVWKDDIKDIHSLDRNDYEYLMDTVDITRNALIKKYKVEKVYLLYLDEIKHVHWHLVPRYNEKGFNVLNHSPEKTDNFEAAKELKSLFIQKKTLLNKQK